TNSRVHSTTAMAARPASGIFIHASIMPPPQPPDGHRDSRKIAAGEWAWAVGTAAAPPSYTRNRRSPREAGSRALEAPDWRFTSPLRAPTLGLTLEIRGRVANDRAVVRVSYSMSQSRQSRSERI